MTELRKFADAEAAAAGCAQQILDWLRETLEKREFASLAISGGSSPRRMFEIFATTHFEWDRVHLFWVDERAVPPSDAQSNFKFANDSWLEPGNFPPSNIHRVLGELDPAEAAARYAHVIEQFFSLSTGGLPHFDVVHRGMGPDAHTASLFPGEPLIADRSGIAAAVWVEKFKQWRITLLPGVLQAARHTALLVAGSDKSAALRSVLNEPFDPVRYPAQIASCSGAVWFVDMAAAQDA